MLRPPYAFFWAKSFIDLVFFAPTLVNSFWKKTLKRLKAQLTKHTEKEMLGVALSLYDTKRSENCYLTTLSHTHKKLGIETTIFGVFIGVRISFCCTFQLQGKFAQCIESIS